MSDRFSQLRSRYLNLGLGELAAATVFALVALMWRSRLESSGAVAALWWALLPLLFVLLQASAYWLLMRSRMPVGKAQAAPDRMPHMAARCFRGLRLLTPVALITGLVGVIVNAPSGAIATVVVAAVWAFGVVEYVNYYLVRLAYPWTRWASEVHQWRTPTLVKDVGAALR